LRPLGTAQGGGEQSVASQPSGRKARRAEVADPDPDERRGWLSHAIAALAISALGLAVAGSVALTTNAQTTGRSSDRVETSVGTSEEVTLGNNRPPGTSKARIATDSASLRAFARRAESAAQTSRTAGVRAAIVNERAAQRAEELSKTAEDVTRTARDASANARSADLAKADQETRLTAFQLAEQHLRRAIATRLAAEYDRQQAEAAANLAGGTDQVDLSNIPTGGGGVSPVPGAVIGAHFGQYGVWSRYHTGLDFRAAYGTPIKAVKAGIVLYVGNSGDWAGNHVAIRHADGMTTMYSHMSSIATSVGATVQAGQIIGYVGQSGRAFGAHLHFELYPVGVKYGDVYKAINPQPWLAANGVRTY
jgi:murein DD-endopeptidase MepM/ murein hydrolase activator NlpD